MASFLIQVGGTGPPILQVGGGGMSNGGITEHTLYTEHGHTNHHKGFQPGLDIKAMGGGSGCLGPGGGG